MRKLFLFFSVRFDPYLLLLLVLSCFALTPLFAPGYFYEAHDGRHSVFYLIMFDASLRDGAWWPRWAMHHIQGYGYPTFIIQAPLGFYLAEIFVLLGAGYTLAAKLAWATGFLVGGWGVYQLTVEWSAQEQPSATDEPSDLEGQSWRGGDGRYALDRVRLAGVAAGLCYVFIPYHLVDIYVRAALNDALLLAWFPWVFLAFDRLIVGGLAAQWQRRLALATLLLAGVLLTHTFALLSFAPLLISFVLFRLGWAWRQRAQHRVGRLVLAGAAGIGALLLYACFLLPLLAEGQPYLQQQVYTTNTYDFRNHFVYLGQFFSSFWGFGYSDDPQGANDGMSFQIGVLALLFGMLSVYVLWHKPKGRALLGYLLGATVVLLWLMTPAARSLWEVVTPLSVIQFPWRLLALTAFTLSLLAGLTLGQLLPTLLPSGASLAEETSGLLLMGLLVIFASVGYVNAQLQPVEPWREDGRAIFRFEREHPDMIAPTIWVKQPFTESPMSKAYAADSYHEDYGPNSSLERLTILKGKGTILSHYSRGSSGGGVVQLAEPSVVRINEYYFPGWQVRIDHELVPIRVSDPYGLIEVDVPAGEHQIDARMGSTPIRRVSALISWATLLVVLGLWCWPWQRKKV